MLRLARIIVTEGYDGPQPFREALFRRYAVEATRRGLAGDIQLHEPCARDATFRPFWNRGVLSRRRSPRWCSGVSTRSVDDLVKAMGMSGISKSQMSPDRRRTRKTHEVTESRSTQG
jgi:transposase-like protein